MANETTYSGFVTYAASINAEEPVVFMADSIMADLVAGYEPENDQTRSVTLRVGSVLTASVVAEGVAAVPQTLSETAVTLTIQKAVVVTKPTLESIKFAGPSAQESRHFEAERAALSKKFDVDTLALAPGFTQFVDMGATATIEGLETAAYTVRNANVPTDEVVSILARKQTSQIGAAIRSATGAFYGNPNFNPGSTQDSTRKGRKGYFGNIFGIDIFESGNVLVDTTPTPDNYVGLTMAPRYAIAAVYPRGSGFLPQFEASVSRELGFLESVFFIKTLMWYQVGEFNDLAAVQMISDI